MLHLVRNVIEACTAYPFSIAHLIASVARRWKTRTDVRMRRAMYDGRAAEPARAAELAYYVEREPLGRVLRPGAIARVSYHGRGYYLRYLLTEEVALILLDVQMPGVSGFELAELIRQREQTQNTPIIFISATSVDKTGGPGGISATFARAP